MIVLSKAPRPRRTGWPEAAIKHGASGLASSVFDDLVAGNPFAMVELYQDLPVVDGHHAVLGARDVEQFARDAAGK